MNRHSWQRFAAGLTLALSALSCAARGDVVRIVEGRAERGRPIAVTAYALYVRATLFEAEGRLEAAQDAYTLVLQHDDRSAAAWTRLGAVRCRLELATAQDAFVRAEKLDPEFEPVWSERARCALASGRLKDARGHAERALSLDPDREATSLLLCRAHAELGEREAAERVLDGLLAEHPHSQNAWQLAYELSRRFRRAPRRLEAARRLWELEPSLRKELEATEPELLPELRLDRALNAGDLALARTLRLISNISPAELALRGAARGRLAEARTQAEHVLGADPTSTDAWIARLLAADLARDPEAFERALAGAELLEEPPSPLALRLLAELLARRAGHDARGAFVTALGSLPEPRDALERELDTQRETDASR